MTDNIFEGLDLSIFDKIPPIGKEVEMEVIEPKTRAEKEKEEKEAKKPRTVAEEDLEEAPEIKEVESIEDLNKSEVEEEEIIETTEGAEEPVTKVWADWMAEKGLIDYKPEEFEDSEAFLVKKFEEQVNKKFNEWQGALPEPIKNLIDNYKEGVPLSELLEIESAIEDYSSIKSEDLEADEKLQKTIVADFLNRDGEYTEKELDEEIKELEDTGMLLNRARRALPKLLDLQIEARNFQVEQAKQANAEAKRQYETWAADFKKKIDSKEELIPGYKLDEKAKKVIFDSITKVVGRDAQGRPINAIAKRRIEDPDFDAKVAYLAEVLNFDLSPAERKGASKATQAMKTGSKEGNNKTGLHAVDIGVVRRALKKMK